MWYYVICLYSNDSELINHCCCALNEKCPSCYRFVSNVTKMSFVLLGNKSVLSHVMIAIDGHEWLQPFSNGQQIIILSEDEWVFHLKKKYFVFTVVTPRTIFTNRSVQKSFISTFLDNLFFASLFKKWNSFFECHWDMTWSWSRD